MKMKRVSNIIFYAIFWIWNLTFLLFVYTGILPNIGGELMKATLAGQIPGEFLVTFLALLAIPTLCTFVGGIRFHKQPVQLIRLFYGVEAPLFLLCLIRLFLLRELTPASHQFIITVIVCIAAFSFELLYGYIGEQVNLNSQRNRTLVWLQVACHSLILLLGLYAGALLLFYALPTAWVLLVAFFKFEWLRVLGEMFTRGFFSELWLLPISFFLFCFTSTLFVAMPVALAALYVHSGRKILKAFASQYSRNHTIKGSVATVGIWFILFISLQQQPQVQAFSLLSKPASTDTARQAILAQSDNIRSGLVNAYLSSYRYLSSWEENNHIREMYQNVFNLPKPAAQVVQNTYNQLMSPFLYNGSRTDGEKAEKLYAEFFDTPIQKAEQKAIQHALKSTANREEAKAGVLNINQKKVWLRSQNITVKPQGDWADIELYEVYENQTPQQQEVFYSFSLPESAVVTGLWLGDTANRDKRFPFAVSPRGAAQKVYNEQVRERVDPALIEQVGPRHYRLRAFPIPPKQPLIPLDNSLQQRPTEMHLWLTYKVMQQDAGWAMPQLGEKRNIYWTNSTKRTQNGQNGADLDDWLPAFIRAEKQEPTLHQVSLPSGDRISVKPLGKQDYSLPQGKRFAIALDSSYSMAKHAKELTQTFAWLKEKGFADSDFTNNDADLYIAASPGAQPRRIDDLRRFDAAKLTFYGTLQPKEILEQFTQLQGDTSYDAILLITDEGSYELSEDTTTIPAITAPLWMVHIGGKLSPAYDDATLKAIQDSSGGVSTQVPEVMQRLATQAALGQSVVSVVDGYAWMREKPTQGNLLTKSPAVVAPTKPSGASLQAVSQENFEPVAARQLVLGLSKEKAKAQLVQLDAIHAVAKSFNIVTPYSSMIVLVNDRQREALKKAEQQSDRFERKVETGKEQLTKPSNLFNVSGVPEPEEWMLLGIIAIALLLIVRRQRSTVT